METDDPMGARPPTIPPALGLRLVDDSLSALRLPTALAGELLKLVSARTYLNRSSLDER